LKKTIWIVLAILTYILISCTNLPGKKIDKEKNTMATINKIEFEQFGPYRFMGKSVYARAGGMLASFDKNSIFGDLLKNSNWIFDELEKLNEYATDENHRVALLTWEKYDEKNKLLGYTVGKFMKAGTPVPDGMDYIDIPAAYVAKGWFSGESDDVNNNCDRLIGEAIAQQDEYIGESWRWSAEVYINDTVTGTYKYSDYVYYIACGIKKKE
jgi:effector-binding domain-containing protein